MGAMPGIGGANAGSGAADPITVTYAGHKQQNDGSSTVSITSLSGGSWAAGDICFFCDYYKNPNPKRVPTGFTQMVDAQNTAGITISARIMNGTETSIQGSIGTNTNNKFLLFVRPSRPVASVSVSGGVASIGDNPSSLSINGSGVGKPGIVIAWGTGQTTVTCGGTMTGKTAITQSVSKFYYDITNTPGNETLTTTAGGTTLEGHIGGVFTFD